MQGEETIPGQPPAGNHGSMDAPTRAGDSPAFRSLGPHAKVAGLAREFVVGLGYLLLQLVNDWVFFADGDLSDKLRGRLYTLLFGWDRGVGVGRFVRFMGIRSISVGAYTRIQRHAVICEHVKIGRHCYIGEHNFLFPHTKIGDHVSMGFRVYIVTKWHPIGPPWKRAAPLQIKPIEIGDGACLNTGAMVLPGCNIGKGSVVAGAAKVTKTVPPNVVVAGNPAVIVRRLSDSA